MKGLHFLTLCILTTSLFWQPSFQAPQSFPDLEPEQDPEPPQIEEEPKSEPQTAPEPPNTGSQLSSPIGGSNFANYNESCVFVQSPDRPGKLCNGLKEITCEDSICKCKANVMNPDQPLVYGLTSQKCVPIASAKNSWVCSDDSQCTQTKYGRYSRCRYDSGSRNGNCECFDTEYKGRDVFFVEGVCYIKKEIGQPCENDMECNTTIAGEAVCEGLQFGVCSCAKGHQFDPKFKECLKLGTVDSDCKSELQCQHEEALGPLSRCHETKRVCECWDTVGLKNTAFHDKRCHFSVGQNETCTSKVECQLGYHHNSDCLQHPSYNGEKVCQCPTGANCKNSGSLSSASLMVTIAGFYVSYSYFSINHF